MQNQMSEYDKYMGDKGKQNYREENDDIEEETSSDGDDIQRHISENK